MKKFLAGTTALVAAGFVATSAQAADPIKISVGGFMNQMVGYVDFDETNSANTELGNYADVTTVSDTEIHFKGSTKLDNGLTVGVVVEYEADPQATTNQDRTDDTFMYISSETMGRLEIGSRKAAVAYVQKPAPMGGLGLHNSDVNSFSNIGNPAGYLSLGYAGIDGQKVNYLTPVVAGFQAAVFYGLAVNNLDTGGANINLRTSGTNYHTGIGAKWDGEVAGAKLNAFVTHEDIRRGGDSTAQNPNSGAAALTNLEDTRALAYGASASMAGFTVGFDASNNTNVGGILSQNVDIYDVAVSYATGPYTLSVGWQSVTDDNGRYINNSDEDYDMFMAAVDYDLGAGVTASATLFSEDLDDETKTSSRKGWGLVTGIKASF